MHIIDTLGELQAYSLLDEVPEFSSFSFNLLLPDSLAELDFGDGEGVVWEKFFPNGNESDMPPYSGVMLSMGYRYDQLSDTGLVNELGYDGAYFFELYEMQFGSKPVYLAEIVVPATEELARNTIGTESTYQWLFECGKQEFYGASAN